MTKTVNTVADFAWRTPRSRRRTNRNTLDRLRQAQVPDHYDVLRAAKY